MSLERFRERDFEKMETHETLKCDFCSEWVNMDSVEDIKVDNGEVMKICENCEDELNELRYEI